MSVVELAGIGPGPFCAMVLADLGADVLRIDRPGAGQAETLGAGILDRGRARVSVDLKHEAGAALVIDLLAGADAAIESFRPGVAERLGIGPDPALERNPRLVYGRLTGFGQDGPMAQRAGHDIGYVSLSGALWPIGERERPVPPLNLVADFGGGTMMLALGIVSALFEARRSGWGQVVDASMVEGSAYLMTMIYELQARGAWTERRASNLVDGGAPFYGTYETADGEFMAVGAIEPKFWQTVLELLGLTGAVGEQWDRDAWPADRERLAAVFCTRTREQWSALFADADACVEPVLRMSEAPDHVQARARGSFEQVEGGSVPAPAPRFDRTPTQLRLTEGDGESALRSRGISAGRIASLRAEGVLG